MTEEQILAFIIDTCYEAAKRNLHLKITVFEGKIHAVAGPPAPKFYAPIDFLAQLQGGDITSKITCD